MSRLLHLDSSLPVVWRSPEGLQIGVDPPIALIDSIDQRYLPVLAALHRRISEEGYDAIASHEGLTPEKTDLFLDELSGALTPRTPDVPHTPIIMSDQSMTVGPRVTPGVGPCLQCVWENHAAREPALVALATQLSTLSAATDTPSFHAVAAWHTRDLVRAAEPGLTYRIDRYTQKNFRPTARSPQAPVFAARLARGPQARAIEGICSVPARSGPIVPAPPSRDRARAGRG